MRNNTHSASCRRRRAVGSRAPSLCNDSEAFYSLLIVGRFVGKITSFFFYPFTVTLNLECPQSILSAVKSYFLTRLFLFFSFRRREQNRTEINPSDQSESRIEHLHGVFLCSRCFMLLTPYLVKHTNTRGRLTQVTSCVINQIRVKIPAALMIRFTCFIV